MSVAYEPDQSRVVTGMRRPAREFPRAARALPGEGLRRFGQFEQSPREKLPKAITRNPRVGNFAGDRRVRSERRRFPN
jgi:hypothetical protein